MRTVTTFIDTGINSYVHDVYYIDDENQFLCNEALNEMHDNGELWPYFEKFDPDKTVVRTVTKPYQD